jgi:hypothetical protein
MEQSDINTKVLLYNPFDKSTALKLADKYEEFNFTFTNLTEKRKVVSYVILLYDLHSPLRVDIHDLFERKRAAAKLSGFKVGSGGYFDKKAEDVMIGENHDINQAIIKYIALFSNPDLTMLISFLDMFWKANRDALKGNPTATKIKNIEALNKTIKRLDKAIFAGDEPIGLRKSLYEHAEEMRIALRPEDVAERLEKGKPGVDIEPYE